MSTIRVRVVAVADASMEKVFAPLQRSAAKARAAVSSEMGKAASEAKKGGDSIYRTAASSEEKTTALVTRESSKRAREEERNQKYVARVRDRYFADQQRQEEQATRDVEQHAKRRSEAVLKATREFGSKAASNIAAIAKVGLGVAGTVAGGMGVDLGVGSHIQNAVGLRASASKISNEGYMPGEGKARISTDTIEAKIKEAADANGFGREGAAAGLQEFVKSTGDLQTGLDDMKQLGALAQAANADFGQTMASAGQVSAALGDVPDKGKRVYEIMKNIAGAGKLGAITIEKLGDSMGKLVGPAGAYAGDKGGNIVALNAFAQIAKEHGGAGSASNALTAVNAMGSNLLTKKQMSKFSGYGIDVMSGDHKTLANPIETLNKALLATGGDIDKMKELYKSSSAWKAVAGSVETFNKAGGGKAGQRAVSEEFNSFGAGASMGDKEINESLSRRLGDVDVKAQQMNNRFDDIAEKLVTQLAPALEKAAPGLEKLATAAANFVAWAAENPGKAITAAIVASIAKAGMETAISKAITSILDRAFKGGGPGGGTPGAGGPGGGTKAIAAIGSFVAGYGVGHEIAVEGGNSVDRAEYAATAGAQIEASNAESMSKTGVFHSQAEKDAALSQQKQEIDDLEGRIDDSKNAPSRFNAIANIGGLIGIGPSNDTQNQQLQDKQHMVELAAAIGRLELAYNATKDRPIVVNVSVPQGAPRVGGEGTVGPGP